MYSHQLGQRRHVQRRDLQHGGKESERPGLVGQIRVVFQVDPFETDGRQMPTPVFFSDMSSRYLKKKEESSTWRQLWFCEVPLTDLYACTSSSRFSYKQIRSSCHHAVIPNLTGLEDWAVVWQAPAGCDWFSDVVASPPLEDAFSLAHGWLHLLVQAVTGGKARALLPAPPQVQYRNRRTRARLPASARIQSVGWRHCWFFVRPQPRAEPPTPRAERPKPRAEPPRIQKHSGNANQNHEQNHQASLPNSRNPNRHSQNHQQNHQNHEQQR